MTVSVVASSLCDGEVVLRRLVDPDRRAVLQALADATGTRWDPSDKTILKFPGPNPQSIQRTDFSRLRAQPYWICEKTNGTRFLLFATRLRDHDLVCLVDRGSRAFVVPFAHFPTAGFQGTVLDGEIVRNLGCGGRWEFHAFDAPIISGVRVGLRPFSARMNAVSRFLEVARADATDPIALFRKHFVSARDAEAVRTHLAVASRHVDTDGVILTPENDPVIYGRHPRMYKLKSDHTVDFLLGSSANDLGERDLLVYDPAAGKDAHVVVAWARVPPEVPCGSIVECRRVGSEWHFACARLDKSHANDVRTFEATTVVNVQEALELDDIFAALSEDRRGSKRAPLKPAAAS